MKIPSSKDVKPSPAQKIRAVLPLDANDDRKESIMVEHQIGKNEFVSWSLCFSQNMKGFSEPSQFLQNRMFFVIIKLVVDTRETRHRRRVNPKEEIN